MEVITIEKTAWDDISKRISDILSRLKSPEKKSDEVWLTTSEFESTMGISKRTAQEYRDTGLVSFSQVGNKIYYKLSDVEELLQRHYVKGTQKAKPHGNLKN